MILVTGATGTVGSQVVRALVDEGVHFRAGIHSRPLEFDGVKSWPIDFDQPDTLPPALEGVRTVFLLSDQILHEKTMVEAAREAGVERIVKLSAWKAGDEAFMIARFHREVERAIEQSGMTWTFLRPNFFMQIFVTWFGEVIRNENAIYDSVGDARVSNVDARDIGRVAARVLTESGHDGKAYDLSGPAAPSRVEIVEMLSEALGRSIRYIHVSDEEYQQRLITMGFSEEDATLLADANRYIRTDAGSAVNTSVKDITGRAPNSFEVFCHDYALALGAEEHVEQWAGIGERENEGKGEGELAGMDERRRGSLRETEKRSMKETDS